MRVMRYRQQLPWSGDLREDRIGARIEADDGRVARRGPLRDGPTSAECQTQAGGRPKPQGTEALESPYSRGRRTVGLGPRRGRASDQSLSRAPTYAERPACA